ncbi:tachykinin-like peptides receptor 99D [Actinia tenebrosa]|uniref:Tachykinin-like peptides receptor 99D n=1 Tax=Actinia tenebrosa TaxID=6105 RepID=A0A6P8HDY5_ACTTE|nr:tachykinin-like peptides receptor 99D [Actinia tenebrosa]
MNLTNSSLALQQNGEVCDISSSLGATVCKALAYIIIFFVSAIGNIIVIGVVLRTKSPRGVMDIFIVNMAFSDLFVPFLMVPKELFEVISGSLEWQVGGLVGNVFCKLYFFIADISPIVSTLTLYCITVERFLAVTRPKLPSYKEPKLHLIMVVLTWIIAMGYCAPYMYVFRLERVENPSEGTNGTTILSCGINWAPAFDHVTSHMAYITATCVLFVIIPFFSLTCMYTYLVIKARASYKIMAHSLSPRAKKRRAIKMWTLLKLSIAVVLGFAICWAPFNVGMFLLIFIWHGKPPTSCFFETYWFVAILMSASNAAVNPWIYLVFVDRFKKQLQEIRKSFSSMLSLRSLSPVQQSADIEKEGCGKMEPVAV